MCEDDFAEKVTLCTGDEITVLVAVDRPLVDSGGQSIPIQEGRIWVKSDDLAAMGTTNDDAVLTATIRGEEWNLVQTGVDSYGLTPFEARRLNSEELRTNHTDLNDEQYR